MPPHKRVLTLISFACMWSLLAAIAQADTNAGRPLWRFFDARSMGAADVTRAVQFDERGLLYAANELGLLSFDGSTWSLTTTGPVPTPIHTVLNLGNGTWLAGGPQVLGTFSPTSLGTHAWRPYPGTANDSNSFDDSVLSLIRHQDSIYVITDRAVLSADDGLLSSIFEGSLTGFSYTAPSDDLVVATESDLIRIAGEKSTTIQTPPEWAAVVPVCALTDAHGKTVIVTQRSGPFTIAIVDDVLSMTPLWEVLPAALETKIVTAALQSEDGTFVFGTHDGAVIQLNSDGSVVTSLDERNGFKVGSIHALAARADGNLFAFFDEGAAWMNLADPRRVWDSVNGLEGSVSALSHDRDTVFASTNRGLYRTASGHRMREVPGAGSRPILTLNTFRRSNMQGHTSLLVGRDDGLFDYFDNQLRQISTIKPSVVFVSRTQPTRIAVGTMNSIALFEFDSGDWQDLGVLGPKSSHAVTDITETPEGDLLAVLTDNTVIRFVADQWLGDGQLDKLVPASTQTFSRKSRANARPRFATDGDSIHLFLPESGLMWDLRTERFKADTNLATQVAKIPSEVMPSWHSAARSDDLLWLQSHANSYVMKTNTAALIQLPFPTNGTRLFNSVLINQQSKSILFATPNGVMALPANWPDLASQNAPLARLSLRGISLDGDKFYNGEGLHPAVTLSSRVSNLTLDLGILDWGTSCSQADLKLEFLQSSRSAKSVPVNSRCTATLPSTELSNFSGNFAVRLTHNGEPVSTSLDLDLRTSTAWYAGVAGPIGLALLLAGASIAGGQKARRVWPEPARRYLCLFSGLCLCLAIAISINTAYQVESVNSFASWFVGLALVSLFLPIYTEILMRLGDRSWKPAR